jgi:peptide/nickel transport system permease protein
MGLKEYALKRAAQCFFTILLVLLINFFIFRIMPGDPTRYLLKEAMGRISPEEMDHLRSNFGLDKPLYVQLWLYLVNTFQGDLGVSFQYRLPVAEVLVPRLLNTIWLILPATILSIIIGLLLGTLASWKRGSKTDLTITLFSLVTWSMPTFWFGMIVVIAFAGFFPVQGMSTPGITYDSIFGLISDRLYHMFLPVVTLALLYIGQYSLLMKTELTNVLCEDYIWTAKAKGLSDRKVLGHGFENALLPIITIISLNLGLMVAGSIQIETVFSWPGIGKLTYDAIMVRDYPVLQGSFLVLTVCVILADFCADLVYSYLDPRIKYG